MDCEKITHLDIYCDCSGQPVKMVLIKHYEPLIEAVYQCTLCGKKKLAKCYPSLNELTVREY